MCKIKVFFTVLISLKYNWQFKWKLITMCCKNYNISGSKDGSENMNTKVLALYVI